MGIKIFIFHLKIYILSTILTLSPSSTVLFSDDFYFYFWNKYLISILYFSLTNVEVRNQSTFIFISTATYHSIWSVVKTQSIFIEFNNSQISVKHGLFTGYYGDKRQCKTGIILQCNLQNKTYQDFIKMLWDNYLNPFPILAFLLFSRLCQYLDHLLMFDNGISSVP